MSVATVALHLTIFRPTRLASQPAKREKCLAFLFLSWQADTGPFEIQIIFFMVLSAKQRAK